MRIFNTFDTKLLIASAATMLMGFGCASFGDKKDEAAEVESAPASEEQNAAPAESEAKEEVQEEAAVPAAEMPPSTTEEAMGSPSTDTLSQTVPQWVVRYVKSESLAVRESPESSARQVGKLHKGDHIFVSVEGDWAKLSDGRFVEAAKLSSKAIPRHRQKAKWSTAH